MGYSVDILNNIRMNASEDYQNRIPEATRNNLAEIGQAFQTYDVLFNEFHSALINKIGKTIIEQKMFENKLARFKSGGITSPHDIEEIFQEMAKAEGPYDPEGKNPLGRRVGPGVKVAYHREGRKDKYVISLGDLDFVRVFRSEAQLDTFLRGKINAVYSGDNRDEWILMKNLIGSYKAVDEEGNKTTECGYFSYDVTAMDQADSKEEFAKEFVKAVRKAVLDQSFLSDQYNVAGVERQASAKDLVLFVHKDVLVEVDVERLATAFHQSNTDLKVVPTIIAMDDFGEISEDTYAVMVEEDWFRVFDTLQKMEPIRNPDGLFTNYFYHHHQIISASPFKNAVRFKKATV